GAGPLNAPEVGEVVLAEGSVHSGFHLPGIGLWLLTDGEVFGREKRRTVRPRRSEESNATRLRSFQDLQAGDYVVHVQHGIGRYLGMRAMEIEGVQKEYLHLSYAHGDKLYVPVEQIDLVQKYVGQGGAGAASLPPGRRRLAPGQEPSPDLGARDGRRASETLRGAGGRSGPCVLPELGVARPD
ncbi:Transcription factor CarD domain protein, partial [mine drainage metagenome]